jgi:hypothetical protein
VRHAHGGELQVSALHGRSQSVAGHRSGSVFHATPAL